MSTALTHAAALPPTRPETLSRLAAVERVLSRCESTPIRTEHVLHGGLYARTIRLAPGTVITGCLYRVPTLLIVEGQCKVLIDDGWAELAGYQVCPASAGRKQIFVAMTETRITMVYATRAQTVTEAEDEMTEDAERLISRQSADDVVIVTGE